MKNWGYSGSMDNELNKPYNINITPIQNTQDEILNTSGTIVRLKGDCGEYSHIMRE